jgi:hypothetical protein
MDIQDILKQGDSVGDVNYIGLIPLKVAGLELKASNFSVLNLPCLFESSPATKMMQIALDGLVKHPVNKIAYVVCFREDYAVCAYSYDGEHFGQFELRLKG